VASEAGKPREDPRARGSGQASYAVQVSRGRTTLQALLNGQTHLLIEHQGEAYTLRLTKNNKLILTK
jgi:hemin uptake protein HemP